MLSSKQKELLLEKFVTLVELPDSAYERAKERYEDLGEYLGREGSACEPHDPHIFPQGSFRLGIAIRPLHQREQYDLDLTCELTRGISAATHTQKQLKDLVGAELRSYRVARRIEEPLTEKHRCWRLEYADHLSFHMDIVPSIPANQYKRQLLTDAMTRAGREAGLAADVSRFAISITDNRLPNYDRTADDWLLSNPEGYARWFEARMRPRTPMFLEKKAQVDELPVYRRKTPLQRSVQLLKRHRDQMFKDDPDVKPISVIITTLAAEGYDGEASLEVAFAAILRRLSQVADSGSTVVSNPVNPAENFADKWTMPAYRHLRLRENFVNWVAQANADFAALGSAMDLNFIVEQAEDRLAVRATAGDLGTLLGISVGRSIQVGKSHEVPRDSAKPWRT